MAASPRDAVLFALLTLKEVQFAWNLAYSLGLGSDDVWERLATAYEKVDPLAVLPPRPARRQRTTEAGAQRPDRRSSVGEDAQAGHRVGRGGRS